MNARQTLQRAALRVHRVVYERTGGLLGHRMVGVPSLLLRTTGRRTGQRRTTALIYARDGTDYVLVASNHGLDRDPGWLLNIRSDPTVGIQVARRRTEGRARVVERGDPDYARLWQLANDNNHHRYEGYQSATRRPIPLVAVTPDRPLG